MEVLDTTIANVALPYIAGGLGVSEDEASWVVTTYLVANAVILTASSFLAQLFGRKPSSLSAWRCSPRARCCAALPGTCSRCCSSASCRASAAAAWCRSRSRSSRDAFPPAKRGQGFALFGVAVVVAPVVGPTLGGWLSDNFSWHWCFLINGPVGVVAIALIVVAPARVRSRGRGAPALRAQGGWLRSRRLPAGRDLPRRSRVVLDRGLEDDWFASSFICRGRCRLRARLRADDPVGDHPPQSR